MPSAHKATRLRRVALFGGGSDEWSGEISCLLLMKKDQILSHEVTAGPSEAAREARPRERRAEVIVQCKAFTVDRSSLPQPPVGIHFVLLSRTIQRSSPNHRCPGFGDTRLRAGTSAPSRLRVSTGPTLPAVHIGGVFHLLVRFLKSQIR